MFSSQSLITSFSDLATLKRTLEVLATAPPLLFWPRWWRVGSSHHAFSFSVGLSLVEDGEEGEEEEEEVEETQSGLVNPLDCPAPEIKSVNPSTSVLVSTQQSARPSCSSVGTSVKSGRIKRCVFIIFWPSNIIEVATRELEQQQTFWWEMETNLCFYIPLSVLPINSGVGASVNRFGEGGSGKKKPFSKSSESPSVPCR